MPRIFSNDFLQGLCGRIEKQIKGSRTIAVMKRSAAWIRVVSKVIEHADPLRL